MNDGRDDLRRELSLREEMEFSRVNGLEKVVGILSTKVFFHEKAKVFGKELLNNAPLEGPCILICEIGDVLTTGLSVVSGVASSFISNALGGFGGVGFGGSYAKWHIKRDAESHGAIPSGMEIFKAVASTESGCILGATFATSALGYFTSVNYDVFSPEGLVIRAVGLIPAFVVGDIAMSALSLAKKSEAGRFVAGRKQIPDLRERLYEDARNLFGNKCDTPSIKRKDGKIVLRLKNNSLRISEKTLPELYHDRFNPDENGLYTVNSPLVRYVPEFKGGLVSYLAQSMEDISGRVFPVKDPFAHDHSHSHKHTHTH